MSPLDKNIPQIDTNKQEKEIGNKSNSEALSPEQEKIKYLQDKLENIKATEQITKKTAEILYKGLTRDPSIKNDPEAQETIRLFEKYKAEFEKAKQEGKITQEELDKLLETTSQVADSFEYNVGVEYNSETGESEKNELSEEKLKTISNSEFLAISPENRLQYITKNHIDSESISNGSVDNFEFTFTFDGEFNKELYMLTTAGEVLPNKVREASIGNKKYERIGLNGEFYNGNERLVVKEGTQINIDKLGTEEELNKIEEKNNLITDKFIQENSDYTNYREKIDFIVSEGIDTKYIKIIGLDKLNDFDDIKLEEFTTDIGREKDFFNVLENKNKLPNNYEEFEKIIELSKNLRIDFANKSNLTDSEKIELVEKTSKMSINQISNFIEQGDNSIGRTGLNYEGALSKYSGKISKDPKGLIGRVRLRDVIPNTHIELNEHYNKYTLENVPENKREDVVKIIETMPEGWGPIVCRNAIKNSNFSANKPFIAQNLSYKTAVIYYPGKEKADIIPINHGSGIGGIGEVSNVNGSHGTSLGSKELIAQGGGKYKFRLVVKGLEPLVEKFKFNRGEAMNHDPSEFGNSNDESRVIRIHETKDSHRTTRGCSGLEGGDAKELYDAIKKAGGGAQEIFVSKI